MTEGENLSFLFSPPVSLALDSPLSEGAKGGQSRPPLQPFNVPGAFAVG